ncbi:class D sortase [Planococcus sp. FY231025]|uniref:class D sortase n=1 Tax=Planococcus sp. FY231025 TaxID=3455699 RepID=UPI003F9339C8
MRRWIGLFLLVAGLAAAVYGFLGWHDARSSAENLTAAEQKEIEEKAFAAHTATSAAPSDKPLQPVLTTSVRHALGEETASLIIPKLEQKYSVFWGADDETLKQGVGMFISPLTTVPGGNGHTVLSGHRDTVFTGLGELEESDVLMIEYDSGVYVYEITDAWITHEDDRSVIVEKDESTLTLTTCYPFDYIGYAADRYIVQAKLVSASTD